MHHRQYGEQSLDFLGHSNSSNSGLKLESEKIWGRQVHTRTYIKNRKSGVLICIHHHLGHSS